MREDHFGQIEGLRLTDPTVRWRGRAQKFGLEITFDSMLDDLTTEQESKLVSPETCGLALSLALTTKLLDCLTELK